MRNAFVLLSSSFNVPSEKMFFSTVCALLICSIFSAGNMFLCLFISFSTGLHFIALGLYEGKSVVIYIYICIKDI